MLDSPAIGSVNFSPDTVRPLITSDPDTDLRVSWEQNADAWTASVRERLIPSRNAGTDQAILSLLDSFPKGRLLDLGCGEGWLSRAAADQGWHVTGVDASEPLILRAREYAGAEYITLSYDDLNCRPEFAGSFDVIVANFSILGEHISSVLAAIYRILAPRGIFVIQTVHPWVVMSDGAYQDGWREETFNGWSKRFESAMPWYFRTLASWFRELTHARFVVSELREPCSGDTGRPLSLLLVATPVKRELESESRPV